jgi:acetolactate synthase small subunit
MEISNIVKKKIMLLKQEREKANKREREIFEWFENQGIDTTTDEFTDRVGSKITYGEYDSISDIEKMLEDFLNKI